MSDSSTGGYLQPIGVSPEAGQAYRRFLHDFIVGVSGLANELVRPGFQPNPPPSPNIDINWIGFSITSQQADNEPHQEQISDLQSLMRRHETNDINLSFYGPNSQENLMLFRDGVYISQNREQLFLAGVGLVGFGATTHVPELINDRYFDRYDLVLTLRREIRRNYPILTFLIALGVIHGNIGETTLDKDFNTLNVRN